MRLCIAVLVSFVLALSAVAQDKAPKKKAAAPENVQGRITAISKDKATITVDTGAAARQVNVNASTKFLAGHSDDNKPGALDKVQMGNYVSCTGDMDKGVLKAATCVYRDKY